MATRKRGRPRKIGPRPEVAAALELPPVVAIAGEPGATDDALAALDVAERAAAPAPNAGDVAGGASSPAAPTGAPTPPSPAPMPSSSSSSTNGNGTHAPPAPAKPKERSITGRQYSGLDRKQLRTALAIAENRNLELERQVRDVAPVAAAANVVALEKMTAVVISAAFDITALVTSLDEVRLDKDEERELGELGAPAIAPYLGEWAEHAPLLAFGAKLATVITTKVIVVKTIRAKRAAASDARP